MRTRALLVASLVWQVVPGWAAVASTHPPAPPELASAAREIVRRAVGRQVDLPGAVLGATGHNPHTVILQGPEVSASVDVHTGLLVRLYDYEGSGTEPGPPVLDEEDARIRAEAFLARAGLMLPSPWRLDEAGYNPHGMGPHYTFSWRKYHFGIQLPSLVSVDVSAVTGRVQCLFLYDDPVTVAFRVRLPAERAVAAGAGQLHIARPQASDVRLAVWYRPHWPAGPQCLLWRMQLADLDTGKVRAVDVDADTGQVTQARETMGETGLAKAPPRVAAHPRPDLKTAARARVPPTLFELAGPWQWAKLTPAKRGEGTPPAAQPRR